MPGNSSRTNNSAIIGYIIISIALLRWPIDVHRLSYEMRRQFNSPIVRIFCVFRAFVRFVSRKKKPKKKIHFRSHRPKNGAKEWKNENMSEETKRKYSHSFTQYGFYGRNMCSRCVRIEWMKMGRGKKKVAEKENRNLYSGSDFQSTNTTYFHRTI